jgi:hypothetical protein
LKKEKVYARQCLELVPLGIEVVEQGIGRGRRKDVIEIGREMVEG